MANLDSLHVRPVDIDTATPGKTVISSEQLATRLVRRRGDGDADDPLNILRMASSNVSLDHISIDARGRVVIENEEFREAVSNAIQAMEPHDLLSANGFCGVGCPIA